MGKSEAETFVDLETPISEIYTRNSKHRSCCKHMAACLYARGEKISKKRAEELKSFKLTSPCLLGSLPCRERSKREMRCKNALTKVVREKGKLDNIAFDCYFENLWKSFTEEKRNSFTYLSCLWFYAYEKESSKETALKWIKSKEVFSKKYVLAPIVCWGHWSLLIFCNLGESFQSKTRTPCMLLLDSLEMANPRRFEPKIRKFLLDIYTLEGRAEDKRLISKIPFMVPKVPQQRNAVECGKYVLYYINLFVQCAPENFTIEGYPCFMKRNWFSPESLEQFFEKLEPVNP